MNKKLIYALLLIALTVLVLIFNRGDVTVELLVTSVRALKSLVFLTFVAIGVVIGLLLR